MVPSVAINKAKFVFLVAWKILSGITIFSLHSLQQISALIGDGLFPYSLNLLSQISQFLSLMTSNLSSFGTSAYPPQVPCI
jgi:hypothetical protein